MPKYSMLDIENYLEQYKTLYGQSEEFKKQYERLKTSEKLYLMFFLHRFNSVKNNIFSDKVIASAIKKFFVSYVDNPYYRRNVLKEETNFDSYSDDSKKFLIELDHEFILAFLNEERKELSKTAALKRKIVDSIKMFELQKPSWFIARIKAKFPIEEIEEQEGFTDFINRMFKQSEEVDSVIYGCGKTLGGYIDKEINYNKLDESRQQILDLKNLS